MTIPIVYPNYCINLCYLITLRMLLTYFKLKPRDCINKHKRHSKTVRKDYWMSTKTNKRRSFFLNLVLRRKLVEIQWDLKLRRKCAVANTQAFRVKATCNLLRVIAADIIFSGYQTQDLDNISRYTFKDTKNF